MQVRKIFAILLSFKPKSDMIQKDQVLCRRPNITKSTIGEFRVNFAKASSLALTRSFPSLRSGTFHSCTPGNALPGHSWRGIYKIKKPHLSMRLQRIWQLPTLPHCGAVPSAMRGLTSLFGMGRGEHPRQNHHKNINVSECSSDTQ